MKKFFLLTTSLFICFAFSSRKELNFICSDYRDTFVGNYFCNTSSTLINVSKGPYEKKGTRTINVSKDAQDSILLIVIGSYNLKFKLKNSKLIAYPDGGRYGGVFYATDSIGLDILTGRASSLRLNGKKL